MSASRSTSSMVTFQTLGDKRVKFCLPRGLLFSASLVKDSDQDPVAALSKVASSSTWAILMASGGHFAGAVFEKSASKPTLHKTFHRYVVRAKAGGRQSAKDATGKKANSAGASLRRHNERALVEDIHNLLCEAWKDDMEKADVIFVHAPGVHNASIFFGKEKGKQRVFDRKDERIRKVPFITRRPTLKEVCRIKMLLSTLHVPKKITQGAPAKSKDISKKQKEPKEQKEQLPRSDQGTEGAAEGEEITRASGEGEGEGEDPSNINEESRLHVAARSGDAGEVLRLLENGANPCDKDLRGRPPYLVAKSKDVRDTFRRFRASAGEEAFDWKGNAKFLCKPQHLPLSFEIQFISTQPFYQPSAP